MPRLTWDDTGNRLYETGTKMGVLYPQESGAYPKGVAWNGLTSVTESPSGAEANAVYADDIKYVELRSAEEFGGTIEAVTFPDEWYQCDGQTELGKGVYIGQQNRKPFGLAFRTVLGNDVQLNDHGYKLHLIYNATASPSERQYQTINDSPETITFSWEFTTTPINVEGHTPTSEIIIDSTKTEAEKLKKIEDLLYGTESESATLPTPTEILTILNATD